jgi:hypothetical protein
MLLRDLTVSDDKKLAKINKALKEAFGFTLVSNIESGKLRSLYRKVADDLYNLKLDLGNAQDKEYAKKLLVKEGLGILLNKQEKLNESLLAGPGANAYQRVIAWLTDYVNNACEVGDDYEEAVYEAMKHYRSSKYRFNDAMVEQDLRSETVHCADVPEIANVASVPAGMDPMDSVAPADFDLVRESAPPGMEDEVLKLKKQYPGEEEKAFATAWSIYNKKKGKSPAKEGVLPAGADKPYEWKYPDKPEGVLKLSKDQLKAMGDSAKKHNAKMDARYGKKIKEDAGHSILDIITPEELERLRGYVAGNGELYTDELLFDKLYSYYVNSGEMPYGVAKARTGDPDLWILDQVQADYGDEVLGVEEGGRNPDRHADREWMAQVSRETAAKKQKSPGARGGDELSLASDNYGDDGEDYYSYMSKKKTTRETTEMKEGYVKQLRRLLEAEVEQAESLIAAKGFSQELQDMVEKLGRLVNEDLPAVVEQMRDAYGADVATGFENSASQTLNGVMDSLRTSKQEIDNSVSSIAGGQAPAASSDMEDPTLNGAEGGMDAGLEGDEDLDLDLDADLDLGDEEGLEMGDDLDIEEPLGRAQKESVNKKAALKKRILETQAKIARLTVAKKKAKK